MNNNFIKKNKIKNNYIIENIKYKLKKNNKKNESIEKKHIFYLKSIFYKVFLLLCLTFVIYVFVIEQIINYIAIIIQYFFNNTKIFFNFQCLKLGVIPWDMNQKKIWITYSLICIIFFIIYFITKFFIIMSINRINEKKQKKIAIILALVEGTFLYLFKLLINSFINLSFFIFFYFFVNLILNLISYFLFFQTNIELKEKSKLLKIILINLYTILIFYCFLFLPESEYYITIKQKILLSLITLISFIMNYINLLIDFNDACFIVLQKEEQNNEWKIVLGFFANFVFSFIRHISILLNFIFSKKTKK
jgi:hypothetical protein